MPGEYKRIPSIDFYRGTVISLMILANFFHYFETIPGWLKHAGLFEGLNFIDLGAPIFFFILGIGFALSLEKRLLGHGLKKSIIHFILRYGTLWIFGFLGVLILSFDLVFGWNVLMALGFSGLVVFPLMFLKPPYRMGAGVLLLLGYQFIILPQYSEKILAVDMGGYFAALSWGGLILMASWWWPLIKEGNTKKINLHALVVSLASIIISAAVSLVAQPNKPLASMSYILLSYAVAVAALALFVNTENYFPGKFPPLKTMGKNPLFIYMFHGVLVELSKSVLKPDLRGTIVILFGLILLSACFLVARSLERKNIYIKL
ncbi:MAG: heparan-alpha-glucosaminide N-acetyltransferase domain-containing protein [Candidatus Aminicenantales bacterium]